jgi:hypothetical protein
VAVIGNRLFRRAAALDAATNLTYTHGSARQVARQVLAVADLFETWLAQPAPVASFAITADVPTDRPTEGHPMSLSFTDGQQDTLRVGGVVDSWNESVTDTFTWTVDNADVLVLTPADDTLSCLVVPGTVPGSAVVTATADSDGVARTFAIDVTTGPTATFEILSDGPVDRPVVPAP